jgi:hypothetical protein
MITITQLLGFDEKSLLKPHMHYLSMKKPLRYFIDYEDDVVGFLL